VSMVISSNPFRPAEVVGEFEECASTDVPDVLKRAAAGRREWNAIPATVRSQALHAAASALDGRREEVATLVVREVGKPITEARGEVQRGIDILRYHAGAILMSEGEVLPGSTVSGVQFTRRKPLGTVAVVTPWNFPVAIPLWKAVPALAWGNAVALKPSSGAVGVAQALVDIISPFLPTGLLQNLPGGGRLVRELIGSEQIQGISFTGSTNVGLQLIKQAAERAIPCQAEMGGSNPTVVLADADLERAVASVAGAAMGFAGQKCTATSRIIVEDAIYEQFRDRLVAYVESMPVGDPAADATVSGPVISQDALDEALAAIESSTGRTLTGATVTGDGYTLSPTLVEVGDVDVLLEQEVFAPVAALVRASDAIDALRRASDTPFGLSAGLFTNDLSRTLEFADAAEAGMLRINAPTTGVDFWAPFGGMKSSSYGTREQGQSARDFFTHGVTVFIDR
jgi:acyl-CoA reductase-like NAD-dependent aldehyde dehydrogenase